MPITVHVDALKMLGHPWWRHQMETFSHVTGHLCGEFTDPRWIPRTKASDAELWCFFDLCLNKRLSKQWWGWWFETLSHPLWRHRNASNHCSCRCPKDAWPPAGTPLIEKLKTMFSKDYLAIEFGFAFVWSDDFVSNGRRGPMKYFWCQHG